MMEYDFVVVGGGSAGYAGARTAVDLGLRTAVIEEGHRGSLHPPWLYAEQDVVGICETVPRSSESG